MRKVENRTLLKYVQIEEKSYSFPIIFFGKSARQFGNMTRLCTSGLCNNVKDGPIFFSKRQDFLKKSATSYDFETFTNGFLAKNCIRISRHLRTKFFPPKLEI